MQPVCLSRSGAKPECASQREQSELVAGRQWEHTELERYGAGTQPECVSHSEHPELAGEHPELAGLSKGHHGEHPELAGVAHKHASQCEHPELAAVNQGEQPKLAAGRSGAECQHEDDAHPLLQSSPLPYGIFYGLRGGDA